MSETPDSVPQSQRSDNLKVTASVRPRSAHCSPPWSQPCYKGKPALFSEGGPHTLGVGLRVTSPTVQMAGYLDEACLHSEIFRAQPLQVFMPSHSSCWENKNAI